MTVFGLFFIGGATMLFGVLEYIPARENTELQYLTIAFTIRTAHALGSTAFSPSARTVLSVTFPKNTTTVMVSCMSLNRLYQGLHFVLCF